MEFLGRTYHLDLAFSFSDIISVVAIVITGCIAWQTWKLQKQYNELITKQTKNDFFSTRQQIYVKTISLVIHLGMNIGVEEPNFAYKYLGNERRNTHYFDSKINSLIQELRIIYKRKLEITGNDNGLLADETKIITDADELKNEKEKIQKGVTPIWDKLKPKFDDYFYGSKC